MRITIEDDNGMAVWDRGFDYYEGEDTQVIQALLKALRLLERQGVIVVEE